MWLCFEEFLSKIQNAPKGILIIEKPYTVFIKKFEKNLKKR